MAEYEQKTKAQHLAWCKERALEYVEKDSVSEAMASFASDMGKHPETQEVFATMMVLSMAALMQDTTQGGTDNTRSFIEGF